MMYKYNDQKQNLTNIVQPWFFNQLRKDIFQNIILIINLLLKYINNENNICYLFYDILWTDVLILDILFDVTVIFAKIFNISAIVI